MADKEVSLRWIWSSRTSSGIPVRKGCWSSVPLQISLQRSWETGKTWLEGIIPSGFQSAKMSQKTPFGAVGARIPRQIYGTQRNSHRNSCINTGDLWQRRVEVELELPPSKPWSFRLPRIGAKWSEEPVRPGREF